jgi:hypothetical protein
MSSGLETLRVLLRFAVPVARDDLVAVGLALVAVDFDFAAVADFGLAAVRLVAGFGFAAERDLEGEDFGGGMGRGYPIRNSSNAFCECRRFSA